MICPTRGRAERIGEMIESFESTRSKGTDIVFYVATDDPDLLKYRQLEAMKGRTVYGDRLNLAQVCNKFALSKRYDYYMCGNDDYFFQTKEWDKLLMSAIPNGVGVAYAKDCIHSETSGVPSIAVIGGETVRKLGYMVYPNFVHLMADVSWGDIGRKLNKLVYVPEAVIEHRHMLVNKAPNDQTYRDVYGNPENLREKQSYEKWKQEELPKI